MDISVSHLNRRMALQVPSELPLGLVFIVGHARNLRECEPAGLSLQLEIADDDHHLYCRLPKKLAEETLLEEGLRIRVGGQLSFEARAVRYVLLIRHLEVLAPRFAERPSHTSESAAIPQQSTLVRAPLPTWVLKLAPPEVQRELGVSGELLAQEAEAFTARAHRRETSSTDGGRIHSTTTNLSHSQPSFAGEESISGLSPEGVDFLSEAMDSEEEVELTSEMVASFAPKESQAVAGKGSAFEVPEPLRKGDPEQTASRASQADLSASFGAWLSSPQLYLIPLLMFLLFLVAIFVFILVQQ